MGRKQSTKLAFSRGMNISNVLSKFDIPESYENDIMQWYSNVPDDKNVFIYERVLNMEKDEEKRGILLPEILEDYINYLIVKKNLVREDVRKFCISIVRPLTQNEIKNKEIKDKINTVNQGMFINTDRFILSFISDSYSFETVDLKKFFPSKQVNSAYKAGNIMEVSIKKNEVIHMQLEALIAFKFSMNNLPFFTKEHKDGFRDGTKLKKNLTKRLCFIIDFVGTTEKVQENLSTKMDLFDDIADSKVGRKNASLIKSYKESAEEFKKMDDLKDLTEPLEEEEEEEDNRKISGDSDNSDNEELDELEQRVMEDI